MSDFHSYPRHCRRSSKLIQKSSTLRSLAITKDFLNETYVKEDVNFASVEDWEDFFLSSLKRNVIAMVSKPTKVSTTGSCYGDTNKVVKDEELVHILPNVNFKKTSLEGEICRLLFDLLIDQTQFFFILYC